MSAAPPRNVFGPVYPTSDGERMEAIFGILDGDRVLEVGGGFYQFPRADVVTDITFSDSGGRNGAQLLFREGCTYVECAAESLPFRDKEFDFVYCSHVLEHTIDPARACAELQRVARRGYLEVPSRHSEVLVGNPTHRWMVSRDPDGTLVFEPRPFLDSPFRNVLHAHVLADPGFERLAQLEYRNLLNLQVEWRGSFPYRVVRTGSGFDYSDPGQAGLAHALFAWNNLASGAPCEYALADAFEATRFRPYDPFGWHVLAIYQGKLLMIRDALRSLATAEEKGDRSPALAANRDLLERLGKEGVGDTGALVLPEKPAGAGVDPGPAGASDARLAAAPSPSAPAAALVTVIAVAPEDKFACEESLLALVSQTHRPIEVVVIAPAASPAALFLSRVRTEVAFRRIDPPPPGTKRGEALNRALNEARGEFVAYSDREDVLGIFHVQRALRLLGAVKGDAVHSDALRIAVRRGAGEAPRFDWAREFLLSREFKPGAFPADGGIPLSCIVHRRAAAQAVHGFDAALDELHGQDLLLRLSRTTKVHHLPEATVELRPRAETTPSLRPEDLSAEHRRIVDNYSRFEPLELMRKVVELYNQNAYLRREIEKLRSGH